MTKEEIIQALEDLQKRVEKIERETIHILKQASMLLYLTSIIHILMLII